MKITNPPSGHDDLSGVSTSDHHTKYSDANAQAAVVEDAAYGAGWNADTTHAPSQNAVYDQLEAVKASDTAYAGSWDGVTTIAPSKNAIYDKIQALPTFIAVVKEDDQAVNNSTTLINDDDLLFAVAANEDWVFMAYLCTEEDGSTSADFKTLFTGPSGSSLTYAQIAPKTTISDMGNVSDLNMAGTKTGASFSSGNVSDAGTELATRIWWGSIINGSTAGSLQLEWAQASAVAVATTLLAGSYIVGWKV